MPLIVLLLKCVCVGRRARLEALARSAHLALAWRGAGKRRESGRVSGSLEVRGCCQDASSHPAFEFWSGCEFCSGEICSFVKGACFWCSRRLCLIVVTAELRDLEGVKTKAVW
jgi:hypothetical protein